jgi:hypothetical protein
MALFCAYNIDWTGYTEIQLNSIVEDDTADPDKSISGANFVICYTTEEELWVTNQVSVL